MSDMLKEVSSLHKEMKSVATAGEAELPSGAAPVVEPPVEEAAAPAEAAPVEETPEAEAPKAEPETLIRIGSQVFKSQAEAIAYAERLEEEKLVSEAYQSGVRDAIQSQAPAASVAPQEDNFEEEFYSNPKATLAKIKEQAKSEIREENSAAQRKENLWRTFEERYPDIDRRDAELILAQNVDTVGKMTDIDKAMEVIARKTRAEYQRIVERYKPRTELPASRGQATVPSSASGRGVTPQKKDEPVLTMAQQMKNLREQKRSPA